MAGDDGTDYYQSDDQEQRDKIAKLLLWLQMQSEGGGDVAGGAFGAPDATGTAPSTGGQPGTPGTPSNPDNPSPPTSGQFDNPSTNPADIVGGGVTPSGVPNTSELGAPANPFGDPGYGVPGFGAPSPGSLTGNTVTQTGFAPFGETPAVGGYGQPGYGPQGFSYGGFNNYGVDPAMTGFGVSNPSNALAPGQISALDNPYESYASVPQGVSYEYGAPVEEGSGPPAGTAAADAYAGAGAFGEEGFAGSDPSGPDPGGYDFDGGVADDGPADGGVADDDDVG
jgi:hypothetical protein